MTKVHVSLKGSLLCTFILFIAFVCCSDSTYAWIQRSVTADVSTAISDFQVTGELYFGDTLYSSRDKILVPINLTDPAAETYIGKMRYVVKYEGISPAYIRVRILEQWIDPMTEELASADYLPYNVTGDLFSPNHPAPDGSYTAAVDIDAQKADPEAIIAERGEWVDNRSEDYCYYYSVPVQPKIIPVQAGNAMIPGTISLTLLDQRDHALSVGKDFELQIIFEVEAVQPNRFREFFGITEWPVSPDSAE